MCYGTGWEALTPFMSQLSITLLIKLKLTCLSSQVPQPCEDAYHCVTLSVIVGVGCEMKLTKVKVVALGPPLPLPVVVLMLHNKCILVCGLSAQFWATYFVRFVNPVTITKPKHWKRNLGHVGILVSRWSMHLHCKIRNLSFRKIKF